MALLTPLRSFDDELLERTLVNLGLPAGELRSDLDLAGLVTEGLPVRSIDALLAHGMPERALYVAVIPKRTLQRRRERREPLTTEESDASERLARLMALAAMVFADDERGVRWLATPKQQFKHLTGFDLARTSLGTLAVRESLLQAYFGQSA